MSLFSNWFGLSKVLEQQEYHEVVKRDYFRNATIFIVFDVFWGLGMTFAMFQTAVPAYMAALNSPKALIGFIVSLGVIMTPFQMVVTHCFRKRRRKVWLMMSYATAVMPWMLYSAMFLFFPESAGLNVKLILFTLCMILFMGFLSPNFPLQFSMITDCTPLKQRGALYGYRTLAQAIGILAIMKLAQSVMDRWSEPSNFLAAFIIGCIFYVICFCIVLAIREHRDPKTIEAAEDDLGIWQFISKMISITKHILKNPRYVRFLVCTILFISSWMVGTLIIVFAKEALTLKGSGVVIFTVLQMASAAVFTVSLGKLADRVGYKTIGVIMGLLLGGAYVFLVFSTVSPAPYVPAVYIGFILWAATIGVWPMTMMNLVIELLPRQNSGILIALTNLLMMPVVVLVAPLAGYVVDRTGSYVHIFAFAAVIAFISSLGFMLFVHEPRKQAVSKAKNIVNS